MRNNIGLLLTKRAALSPAMDGIVEVERQRRFTFPAVNARSNRVADALCGLGVQKGDRVALLLMNGVEFVESYFAIAKIGRSSCRSIGGWSPPSWRSFSATAAPPC
jgi:acyl-CoA synthetase (AMP-forming)/AMP-acid ligase II